MLSIVIPTLNEEKYLPRLLESIKKQGFSDFEIIIADDNSKDNTVNIAKRFSAKIISGGLPAKARNNGAKVAKGDVILFLDADVILPKGFLKKAINVFEKRKLDIGTFFLVPKKSKIAAFLFNLLYNYPIVVFEKILPHAAMAILVKKDIFFEVGGFDEEITLGEDHYFARQVNKKGKFGIIKTKVLISTRRFRKDGWVKTFFKYWSCEVYMTLIGPPKKNNFGKRFSTYFEK